MEVSGGMDADEVRAIDVHVHMADDVALAASGRSEQMARYFRTEVQSVGLDELADRYRALQMKAVLLNVADETVTGRKPVPNDHLASAVRRNSDVFYGFGAVDPRQGRSAKDEIRRCHEELGLRGIGELNPGRQEFYPNDARLYPLWEEAARLGMPIMFHSGMAGAGAGTPGGGGVKLKYCEPIFLDDIAADIPELTIICAHPSWPWQSESLAIAGHKANVYLDLSGWSPKYFPAELVQRMSSLLQDKMMFGSDWPMLTPDRWLADFETIEVKPAVREKILLSNAQKLLDSHG
jgi:uncharacterized protein